MSGSCYLRTGERSPLCLTQSQGLPQVGDVIEALEFGHPAAQQEGEQVDEEAGVLADGEVGFVAHLLEPEPQVPDSDGGGDWCLPVGQVRQQVRPLKLLGLGGLLDSFTDDDEEVLSQHKRNSLPLVAKLFLLVIQEVAEVDVEQLEEQEGAGSGEVVGGAVW